MTDRLNKIFAVLPTCEVFADIGCDHGYMAKAMLDGGKCKKAIISDVSAKCLLKAQTLLARYIKDGKVESAVSDGFDGVGKCDLALIAGMGGEEICSIIERAKIENKLPQLLVIQPMKNCDKARICAVKAGYAIKYDRVFKSGAKFYNLIVLVTGKDNLTDEEIEFGRNNVNNPSVEFKEMVGDTYAKLCALLESSELSKTVRTEIEEKIKKLKKYV